jgi:hypothetical protein
MFAVSIANQFYLKQSLSIILDVLVFGLTLILCYLNSISIKKPIQALGTAEQLKVWQVGRQNVVRVLVDNWWPSSY